MAQSEPPQNAPNGGTVHGDAVGSVQFDHQFVERDLALSGDTCLEPIGYACQLPLSAAIALPLGRQQPGLASQLHQIVDEFGRYPKVPGRLAMSVAFVHIGHDPPPKLHWMWLAHQTPIPASAEGKHIIGKPGILNLDARDTLYHPKSRPCPFTKDRAQHRRTQQNARGANRGRLSSAQEAGVQPCRALNRRLVLLMT